MYRCTQYILLITILFIMGGCSYIDAENPVSHRIAGQFIESITSSQIPTALNLLAPTVRSQINAELWKNTPGDFRGVIESFRTAKITTRSSEELVFSVPLLDGRSQNIRLVFVKEGGVWWLANLLEEKVF